MKLALALGALSLVACQWNETTTSPTSTDSSSSQTLSSSSQISLNNQPGIGLNALPTGNWKIESSLESPQGFGKERYFLRCQGDTINLIEEAQDSLGHWSGGVAEQWVYLGQQAWDGRLFLIKVIRERNRIVNRTEWRFFAKPNAQSTGLLLSLNAFVGKAQGPTQGMAGKWTVDTKTYFFDSDTMNITSSSDYRSSRWVNPFVSPINMDSVSANNLNPVLWTSIKNTTLSQFDSDVYTYHISQDSLFAAEIGDGAWVYLSPE